MADVGVGAVFAAVFCLAVSLLLGNWIVGLLLAVGMLLLASYIGW